MAAIWSLRRHREPQKPQEPPSRPTRAEIERKVDLFKSSLRYNPEKAEFFDTPYYLADVEARLRELEDATP